MTALLAVVLAAAPAWKVSWSTSSGTDVGNGKISATSDVSYVVTPTELVATAGGSDHGKPLKEKTSKKALPAAARDAIAALLPAVPPVSATYSISPTVNDEGWYSEALSVEHEGKAVQFQLVQGKQAPPLPESLEALKKAIGRALAAK